MPNLAVQLAEDSRELGKRAGSVITLALTPADVNISEELDTFLAGFTPFAFRADEVSPPTLVEKDRDQFRTFDDDDAFQEVDVEASIQSPVRQVDPRTSLTEYRVIERSLGSFIPAAVEAQASPLYDPRMASGRRIQNALALNRERRVWTLLETIANWNAANHQAVANDWNDQVNGDPILDIQERIEASAQPVTGIWFNPVISHRFLRHTKVRDHMRQMLGDSPVATATQDGAGVQDALDYRIPGLPPFHVAPGKRKNTAGTALEFILSDVTVLITAPPGGVPTSGEEIQTLQTFRRRGPSGTGFTTREFFVNERGLDGGTMMVSGHAEDVRFIANTAGGLITAI